MIKFGVKVDPARLIIRRADAARDELRYRDAAALYADALALAPHRASIHVQAGHMFKEAGELDRAEFHYLAAIRLMPDDADAALQIAHFYKRSGQPGHAFESFERAARLPAAAAEAEAELASMRRAGWPDAAGSDAARSDTAALAIATLQNGERPGGLQLAPLYGRLAPENMPKPFAEMLHLSQDSINLRHLGVEQNTYWGKKPVLRGVEAIRGFAISSTPLSFVEARINGLPIRREALKGPFELEYELDRDRTHKYVFNLWCDLSGFAPGLYQLELTFFESGQMVHSHVEEFVVEPPLSEDYPASDGIINLAADGVGSIEDQINARPSMVHTAERTDLLSTVRSILVMRPDQLGDLVTSIPAILRLREMFPDAQLVGLFSPANADLARTLNVFDEVIVRDFRESLYQRTRTMTLEEQVQLRDELARYAFDIAIDLSPSLMSRPLLALAGARFTHGFASPNWPRLTASIDDTYHDPKNRKESAAHSSRILALIDRLGSLMKSSARIIRRDDLSRALLRPYRIADGDRFAVLHTGARIVFSRWPHYLELAARLHAETDLKIVLFTGDADLRSKLAPEIADSDRFIILERQLPFDDFDALLSFCAVYVGNDSGPKHLAALRGVPVVSIHSARINWSEWGQEQTGVVITRKVPCAGCALYHDADECGKDYVCINGIPLNDVYDAVRRYV